MLAVKYDFCVEIGKSAQMDTKSMVSMRLLDKTKY